MSEKHDDAKKKTTGFSAHDLRELFSWLKTRMQSTSIDSNDRKQFNDWLVQQVSGHQNIDQKEIQRLKKEFLDQE